MRELTVTATFAMSVDAFDASEQNQFIIAYANATGAAISDVTLSTKLETTAYVSGNLNHFNVTFLQYELAALYGVPVGAITITLKSTSSARRRLHFLSVPSELTIRAGRPIRRLEDNVEYTVTVDPDYAVASGTSVPSLVALAKMPAAMSENANSRANVAIILIIRM